MNDWVVSAAARLPQASPSCRTWRVIGAAVQGTAHARHNLPCQDWQGHRCLPGGGLVIAVADGAGSAPRSERGARRAVEAALDAAVLAVEALLTRVPAPTAVDWEDLLRWVMRAARQAVAARARSEHHRLREYATTLTIAIAAQGWLAVAQIGDGVVVAQDEQGALWAATHLQKGEYANETQFLTLRGALKYVEICAEQRPVQALAAMSDGLVRLALRLPSGEPHLPFFQPLFGFVAGAEDESLAGRRLAAFLASERVCARTDDDKSLVLAVCVDPAEVEGPA